MSRGPHRFRKPCSVVAPAPGPIAGACAIGLRKGGAIVAWTVVDVEDFADLDRYCWALSTHGYAQRLSKSNGRSVNMFMHRVILGVIDPAVHVDHVDGDPLNNRRSNLRTVTRAQNMQNMRNSPRRKAGRLKGVKYQAASKTRPWFGSINYNGGSLNLGYYGSEAEAATAYDLASTFLYADFAAPNSVDHRSLKMAADIIAESVDASRLDSTEERAHFRALVRELVGALRVSKRPTGVKS